MLGGRVTWAEEQLQPDDRSIQSTLRSTGRIPQHIAVIMDGNGRWAQERGRPRVEGHSEGMESVRDIVKVSSQLGVRYLTLYAFSLENWKRPSTEVSFLMRLLESYLVKEFDELHRNNVRICTIGKTNSLPKAVQKVLLSAMERTKENDGLTLTLALSYGSRWDITRAVQMIALDVRRGHVSPEDLTEDTITRYLMTSFMPEPDLLIRSSGEFRISNFLLWELAYTEIYVTDRQWPEFRRFELYKALVDYLRRERRFGMTSQQVRAASDENTTEHLSTLRQILNAFK
jgi:undecaprenyl diphosphate synthase